VAKKKTREQIVEELRTTDASFRRLYDKVVAGNGGRIPTSEEISRDLAATIERYRLRGEP